MPRREGELVGHTTCPECSNRQAEVRLDRAGNPYRKCCSCSPATVYFTHGAPLKVERLFARTRFLTGRDPKPGGALSRQLAALHRTH